MKWLKVMSNLIAELCRALAQLNARVDVVVAQELDPASRYPARRSGWGPTRTLLSTVNDSSRTCLCCPRPASRDDDFVIRVLARGCHHGRTPDTSRLDGGVLASCPGPLQCTVGWYTQ